MAGFAEKITWTDKVVAAPSVSVVPEGLPAVGQKIRDRQFYYDAPIGTKVKVTALSWCITKVSDAQVGWLADHDLIPAHRSDTLRSDGALVVVSYPPPPVPPEPLAVGAKGKPATMWGRMQPGTKFSLLKSGQVKVKALPSADFVAPPVPFVDLVELGMEVRVTADGLRRGPNRETVLEHCLANGRTGWVRRIHRLDDDASPRAWDKYGPMVEIEVGRRGSNDRYWVRLLDCEPV